MKFPFTRFDFNFNGEKIFAEYDDHEDRIEFSFKINEQTEFSVTIIDFHLDHFMAISIFHYGEQLLKEKPTSRLKTSGFAETCISEICKKHPEIRFVVSEANCNEAALHLAERLAQKHRFFFII